MSTTTLAYDIIARDRASSTFTKIGRAAGALGVGLGAAGLVQFAKDSVNVEAQFSSTMASVQVNAGIGQKALGHLSDYAVKMGQDTVYSANEAASAMLELSKGGMSAAQIRAGALSSALNLAATEGIDLGESATIVARTLKTFGLNASSTGKAVDILAAGSLASTASVEGLASGLKYVGSTAKSSGYDLADTVTALAALNDAGLDATTAGTSLNRMLLGLSLGTTKAAETAADLGLKFTDAKGDMLPMEDVVKRLQKAFGDMSTSQRNNDLKKLFGVEGMRAANILIGQGAKGWERYSKKVNETGAAAKMANARMSGTKGALERLDGAVETAQLKLGQFLAPAVQDVANTLTKNLGPAMDGTIDFLGDAAHAAKPFLGILKMAGSAAADAGGFFADLPDPLKQIGIEVAIAAAIMPKLTSGIGAASSALKNGSIYARVYALELQDVETRGAAVSGALSKLGGIAKQAGGVGGMLLLANSTQQANKSMGALEGAAGGALVGMSAGPWGAAIGAVAGGLAGLVGSTHAAAKAARDAQPDFRGLADSLDQVTGATTRATRAQIYDDLERTGALKTLQRYGISNRQAVDAVLGHGKALHSIQAVQAQATAEYKKNADAIARNNAEIERLTASGTDMTTADYDRVDALHKANGALTEQNKKLASETDLIDSEIGALKRSQKATRDKAAAVESLKTLYGKLPKDVVSDIKQNDMPKSLADVKRLIALYNMTPKQVQTLLKQVGIDKSIDQVKRLADQQDRLHDKSMTYTVNYRYTGLRVGGNSPTRGHGSDLPDGGSTGKAGLTGGRSGKAGFAGRTVVGVTGRRPVGATNEMTIPVELLEARRRGGNLRAEPWRRGGGGNGKMDVTINVNGGDPGRNAEEIRKALLRLKRQLGTELGIG